MIVYNSIYNIQTIAIMFSESKVTEIFNWEDDFCNEFAKYQENSCSPPLQRTGNIVISSIV